MDGPAGIWMECSPSWESGLAQGSDARGIAVVGGSDAGHRGMFFDLPDGSVGKDASLFTPLVTGTYLLLLVSQRAGSFQGMLTGANGDFDPLSALIALGCFFLVLLVFRRQRMVEKLCDADRCSPAGFFPGLGRPGAGRRPVLRFRPCLNGDRTSMESALPGSGRFRPAVQHGGQSGGRR